MYSSLSGLKRPFSFSDGGPEGWNSGEDQSNSGDAFTENKRKRRSRWSTNPEEKTVIPGMPTVIPSNLTESQQRQYVVHLQIEEITRKLRTGELGIPANLEERSPSPEPIYNSEGKRMNTREYRTRKKLEEERHKLIQEALKLNPEFKPPGDYKPPIIRVNDKVMIPQEEHPEINFVGLLIGPRGNTLKNLEKETGAKIIIRGKGSVKDGKIGRKDGQPLPGEDEPLHAYVTASVPENVTKAVDKIKEIIRQGIEVPEGQNDLRRQQLRELALLNGTLRENDGLNKLRQIAESQTIVTNTIICTICGGAGHIAQDCKQKRPGDSFKMQQAQNPAERAKMDSEYMSLMAELGEGPPPPPKTEPSTYSSPNFGRTLLSHPPPNPMAINSPWQMNHRPPMGQHTTTAPLLTRPAYGMPMGPPQVNPLGRLQIQGMNSTTQPAPGMQAPPGLAPLMATSQALQQQSPLLGGMGTMPQMQQGADGSRSWQSQQTQSSQVGHTQGMTAASNHVSTSPGSMSVPPPPPASLLAPPPPPPPPPGSSQIQSQLSPSWAHQTQAGKTSLLSSPLPPPPPPPPPPSSGRDSESAFASGSVTPQQQTLLDIQNQVLQKQQQKVALLTQSGRMGETASPNVAVNRGSQPSLAAGGSDNSSSNLSHLLNTRTGQNGGFGGQNNQSMMMMNNQNLHNSSMPQGQMAGRNFDTHFSYRQMSGSDGQSRGHYTGMNMGLGGGAQNLMGPGNNNQNMMNQGNNQPSMMGPGNNHQNMNQRYIPQNMNQGNIHHSMINQGNSQQSVMGHGNNHQNMLNQGNNHQNMINQGNNQNMINQGNNHQNVMNQGNSQQSVNQGKTSQNNVQGGMSSGNNSQNVMNQRNDSPMMNQGNHPQTWNNHPNMENNQMEKGTNSSMWN